VPTVSAAMAYAQPLTGRLIAELICEGKASTLDISPLSLVRFREGTHPRSDDAFRH